MKNIFVTLYALGFLACWAAPCLPSTTELPFIISVCAYNASAWVEKNLESLCTQEYSNFHIVYIDDGSEDDTAQKVENYRTQHNVQDKITLIRNQTRQRKMKNIYTLFHNCPDESIIIQVDADDWLAHNKVFCIINKTYQEQDVWLTYGQFQVHPSKQMGYCRQVPSEIQKNRDYRKYRFVYTHIRTFYAWLVKLIKLQDLIAENMPAPYTGRFFPVANDNAIYFPMLEMCGNRYAFIPDILYIHNHENPQYGRILEPDLYHTARADIRSRRKYEVLKNKTLNRLEAFKDARATAILLSNDNPTGLQTLIESIIAHTSGIKDIVGIYHASNDTINTHYHKVIAQHPSIKCMPVATDSALAALKSCINKSTSGHILLAQDIVYIKKPISFSACIYELERTGAYGFYLNYAQNKMPFYFPQSKKEHIASQILNNELSAWKFNCGTFALYNNIDMTLLRKHDLLTRLDTLEPKATFSLDAFLGAWHTNKAIDGHMIGLYYQDAHLDGGRTRIVTPAIEKPLLSFNLENYYKQQSWLPNDLSKELMHFLK
ncbi:MAG: glycosyltransferase family 2 protein [Candidatus Babeliales bacterium]